MQSASLPTHVILTHLWNKCLELNHAKSCFKYGWHSLTIAESVMNLGCKSLTPSESLLHKVSNSSQWNLKTFLILKAKYGLLHFFSSLYQPLTNVTQFVFHLWLRGCLINSAGPLFSPLALVQRRLKACVILYQEPVIAANAIFVMLYWSQRGEFVFQSGPAHSAVERGVLSSKNASAVQKGLKLISKMRKEREGPARTSYRSSPGCAASVSYRGS